jgi:hypothetical protein
LLLATALPGGGLRNCRALVFKWGWEVLPFKFHLRHRLLGWNPLNGVGGETYPDPDWRLSPWSSLESPKVEPLARQGNKITVGDNPGPNDWSAPFDTGLDLTQRKDSWP